MLPEATAGPPRAGRLADNVVHFARVLRKAGLPVGTDRALLALQALELAGLEARSELHDVLEACLTSRIEHRALFEQAFNVFWRDPHLLAEIMRMRPLEDEPRADLRRPMASRRLIDALLESAPEMQPRLEPHPPAVGGTRPSWSDRERLRTLDFESMSCEESRAAERAIRALEPLLARRRTRRPAASKAGARLALRQLLRDAGRRGGDVAELARQTRRTRLEPVCVVLDISGSMSRYSRMFLHFMHALASGPRCADLRVSAFVFGTRLTHVTRLLKHSDPDEALRRVTTAVADWSGGTRIALSLREFNRRWARRLSLAGSTVLLVTDGLELDHIDLLAQEAQRLERSCKRILWLNPLLRYDGFAPKARGIRALLAHVDEMLPIHNIQSLERLVLALQRPFREYSRWR